MTPQPKPKEKPARASIAPKQECCALHVGLGSKPPIGGDYGGRIKPQA